MTEFKYTITDPVGIHARPAALLAKAVKAHASTVKISTVDGRSEKASSLTSIMRLGIKNGDTIIVSVDGEDEAEAATALEQFLKENL